MNENELEKQFLQLVKIMEQMQKREVELEQYNKILLNGNRQIIDWVKMLEKDVKLLQANMKYEILDPRIQNELLWYPIIAPQERTLDLLINDGKSISRFGDGEFAAISGEVRHKFQTDVDGKLSERLQEVLDSDNDKLLIGIADNYGSLDKYTENAQREIRYYMTSDVRRKHLQILQQGREYHDAYISRPYAMYRDNGSQAPGDRFDKLKQLWKGKNCVFVEGNKTRMGVGNDLFAGAASIKRILGPAENAFRCYESILEECKKMPKDSLFILALGPTASVLAYDLCMDGYQALDLGHVDLEYEWYLQGKGGRTEVPTKYNNELENGHKVVDIMDSRYEEQIVARIISNC